MNTPINMIPMGSGVTITGRPPASPLVLDGDFSQAGVTVGNPQIQNAAMSNATLALSAWRFQPGNGITSDA